MNYKKIMKKIEKYEKGLKLENFKNTIEVKHQDGSVCRFNHATYRDFEDNWFCVFTEHNGNYINNLLDMEYVRYTDDISLYEDGDLDEE